MVSTSATLCVIHVVTTFLVVSVYGSQLSLNELHFVDPTNGGAPAQLQSKEHFGAVGSVFASISRKSTESDLVKTFKLLNQGVDDYAAGKKRKSLPQRLVRILAAKLGTFVPKNTNYVTSTSHTTRGCARSVSSMFNDRATPDQGNEIV